MPKPIYSRRSEVDLLEIWVYLAKDSFTAADRTVTKLREQCAKLAENRGTGQQLSHLRPQMRVVSCGAYLIFFQPLHDTIGVLRVVHGSRDWVSLDWDDQ